VTQSSGWVVNERLGGSQAQPDDCLNKKKRRLEGEGD